jgi:hypothetical protein
MTDDRHLSSVIRHLMKVPPFTTVYSQWTKGPFIVMSGKEIHFGLNSFGSNKIYALFKICLSAHMLGYDQPGI